MAQPRGAGYWLWKPHIIADTLAAVPDGTLVIYTDAAVVYAQDPSSLFAQAALQPISIFRNRMGNALHHRSPSATVPSCSTPTGRGSGTGTN